MGLFAKDPNDMHVYGYRFRWGSLHHSSEDLHHLIYTYDTVAADALEALDEIGTSLAADTREDEPEGVGPKEQRKYRDLYHGLRDHAGEDERLGRLWDEVNTIPEWVDWEQIGRGQKVFWRYGGSAITALTFLSLLGGMGSGRTVETLDRTGGFGAQVVRRRLLETVQHTLGVHKDLDAIKPGGVAGFESSVRVRLLHASVRRRIMKLTQENPDYYNIQEYGYPINNLDCIGTIATFSTALVWGGFPRQGIWLREQEISDYLALWRYVAYLMGTPHDWLASPETAKAMMESLLVSEIKPSKKSAILANNIITGLEGQRPAYASREYLNAEAYWLIGSELAQELELDRPSLFHFTLVAGQCWLFMLAGYIKRSISSWDERNIEHVRKVLYGVLVHNKSFGALGYEAKFSFKWIPDLKNLTTPLGERAKGDSQKNGPLHRAGIERASLITLVSTGVVFGATAWASVHIIKGLGWLAARGWDSMSTSVFSLVSSMESA